MNHLQAEFDIIVDHTKRCDDLTQEIQSSFKSWGGLVQQLREVIIHTQEKGGDDIWKTEQDLMSYTPPVNSTPASPVSAPVLPELDRPSVELVTNMIQAPHQDVLWELLPFVDMWLRRCYKIFTRGAGGRTLDWKYAASIEGMQYLASMFDNIRDCRDMLKTSESAKRAGIMDHLSIVVYVSAPVPIRHAPTDKQSSGLPVQ